MSNNLDIAKNNPKKSKFKTSKRPKKKKKKKKTRRFGAQKLLKQNNKYMITQYATNLLNKIFTNNERKLHKDHLLQLHELFFIILSRQSCYFQNKLKLDNNKKYDI